MDEASDADLPLALRRSKTLAWAAFLAAVTSLMMPWWLVLGVQAGQETSRVATGVFSPQVPYSHPWLPYVTGAMVLVAAGWMFVRIAGRSFLYEPASWRRDLWLQAGLVAVAVLSTQFWPAPEFTGFFETARWAPNATFTGTEDFARVAKAGLGFWAALVSVACLLAAAMTARRS